MSFFLSSMMHNKDVWHIIFYIFDAKHIEEYVQMHIIAECCITIRCSRLCFSLLRDTRHWTAYDEVKAKRRTVSENRLKIRCKSSPRVSPLLCLGDEDGFPCCCSQHHLWALPSQMLASKIRAEHLEQWQLIFWDKYLETLIMHMIILQRWQMFDMSSL